MDWKQVKGKKKKKRVIRKATFYSGKNIVLLYVQRKSCFGKYVCGWQIQFRMGISANKALENIGMFGFIFLFRGC